MILELPTNIQNQIDAHAEEAYPEEVAGFLLGEDGERRQVKAILRLQNSGEEGVRHNRYLITPQDYLHGEQEAARRGLDVIGIFHSHPDSPNLPSEFDREWALPWFSYLITSVQAGKAAGSRSWRLSEDRSHFEAERLLMITPNQKVPSPET